MHTAALVHADGGLRDEQYPALPRALQERPRIERPPPGPQRQAALGQIARDVAAAFPRPLDGGEGGVASRAVRLPAATQVTLEAALLDPRGDGRPG